MTTYGDMTTRVQDELARTDLTSQIQGAIMRAIRNYERRDWWFNEIMFSFSTVAHQEYYTDVDAGNRTISRLKSINPDSCKLIVGNNRYPITNRTWEYIDQVAITTTTYGQPEDFCLYAAQGYGGYDYTSATVYGQQLRLYPIPDLSTYTVQIAGRIGVLNQEGLSDQAFPANTTTDVWSLYGEDLICCRAKWDVCSSYLKDTDAAAIAKSQELDALSAMTRQNTLKQSTGKVMPNPW